MDPGEKIILYASVFFHFHIFLEGIYPLREIKEEHCIQIRFYPESVNWTKVKQVN